MALLPRGRRWSALHRVEETPEIHVECLPLLQRWQVGRTGNHYVVVWNIWLNDVRPKLLEDPSPTNPDLHITETNTTQLWIPNTDVYVLIFPTDDDHVMLIKAVDLFKELG